MLGNQGRLRNRNAAVERSRAELCSDILNGRHEISLSPDQISDPMYWTDRRQDWMSQEAFRSLVNSIASNGSGHTHSGVARGSGLASRIRWSRRTSLVFHLSCLQDAADWRSRRSWVYLFAQSSLRRKRETPRTASLRCCFCGSARMRSARILAHFERLVSIGEMYETLASGADKLTAVAFAKKIGVHESLVSRARSVGSLRRMRS